jgi:hypothetical protein
MHPERPDVHLRLELLVAAFSLVFTNHVAAVSPREGIGVRAVVRGRRQTVGVRRDFRSSGRLASRTKGRMQFNRVGRNRVREIRLGSTRVAGDRRR